MDTVTQPLEIIPSPASSERVWRRFHHHDLDEMTPAQRWAEHVLVTAALAEHIHRRRRPRVLDERLTTDRDWLIDRLRRLQRATRSAPAV
jgi:hypothetical protein